MPAMTSSLGTTTRLVPTILAALTLTACVATTNAPLGPEPPGFAIWNDSTQYLAHFSVEEIPGASGAQSKITVESRVGTISNTPPGAVQLIPRRDNAPALPKEAYLVWQFKSAQRYTERINLRQAATGATGLADEVLTFRFSGLGRPRIYVATLDQLPLR